MVCQKCGADIPEHSKFCLNCGTVIDNKSEDNTEKAMTSGKAPTKIIIALFAVVFVIIAVVLGFLLDDKRNDPSGTGPYSNTEKNNTSASYIVPSSSLDLDQIKESTNSIVRSKYNDISLDNINVLDDGAIFIALSWDLSISGPQIKTLINSCSEDIVDSLRKQYPDIGMVTFTWVIPALDAGALLTFNNTGKTMSLIDEYYDSVFETNSSTEKAASSEPVTTLGEKNALAKAQVYLNAMAFSRSGLIDQLKYEGFSQEESVYAVDHCNADWKEQAAKKAQDYLDTMSFSRAGLIEQLLYEGFTQEEAEYGVAAVGY